VKLLLAADVHLSDRPPSSCTETYQDDLFDLLGQALSVAVGNGCRFLVLAGDTFHLKAPSRVSYRLVHRMCEFIERCRSLGVTVLVLAGNHDLANDRLESARESQPLGMLYRAGAHELNGWFADLPVYGVPWLQGYGNYGAYDGDDPHPPIEVHLADALASYREQVFEHGTGGHVPLVVAHAPLYPPGRELTYEYFPADRWAEAMGAHRGGRHRVFYGHVHEPHGEYGFYGPDGRHGDWDVGFCNNGALSRGSLHEYNLTRQVGVTVYDSADGTFEFIPLDARPAEQVFRLQEKQQATDLQGRLDDFLVSVGGTTLEVMSAETVLAHVRSLEPGKAVEDLVEELLQEALHAQGS
jgi:hypothetical protein